MALPSVCATVRNTRRASRGVAALGQPAGKWGKEGMGRDAWLHLGFPESSQRTSFLSIR